MKLTAEVESNFKDVAPSDYFYNEVGIAKKLGITQGVGMIGSSSGEHIQTGYDGYCCKGNETARKELDESA